MNILYCCIRVYGYCCFFFSSRRRYTRCALVTGVQTCSLPIYIDETMQRGEQRLLFLNRRGYAPLTLCRHCGYRFQCPNCSAWMVEHRLTHRLACHHCGHVVPAPRFCPECKEEDSLVACGPGVERIADEVKEIGRAHV